MPGARTRGIALLAGLVLLSALSLIALIASAGMLAQQRMAANFDDAETARANAEKALSGGQTLLLATPEERRSNGCVMDCFAEPTRTLIHAEGELPALPEFEPAAWWANHALLPGTDAGSGEAPSTGFTPWAEPPRFTLEEIAFRSAAETLAPPEAPAIDGIGYYRILGRGAGRQGTVVAVDELLVARPWTGTPSEDPPASDWDTFCAPFRPWYDCGPLTWRARR